MENDKANISKKERFVRWQQLTLVEMGKIISLFLGIVFATIGFIITQLMRTDFEFRNCWATGFLSIGTLLLLADIGIFLYLILNRQKDLRLTVDIARYKYQEMTDSGIEELREKTKTLGERTHSLFTIALWIFGIAEIMVIVGFIFQFANLL